MGEPVVIQQSDAWEQYPTKVLDQTAQLHEITERGRVTFTEVFSQKASERLRNLGDTVANATEAAATKLAQNKMSDQELAAMLMQGWDPNLAEFIVEGALKHRMKLLKEFSNVRPE